MDQSGAGYVHIKHLHHSHHMHGCIAQNHTSPSGRALGTWVVFCDKSLVTVVNIIAIYLPIPLLAFHKLLAEVPTMSCKMYYTNSWFRSATLYHYIIIIVTWKELMDGTVTPSVRLTPLLLFGGGGGKGGTWTTSGMTPQTCQLPLPSHRPNHAPAIRHLLHRWLLNKNEAL